MLFTSSLKDNKVFLRLYKRGKFVSCEYVTCYFNPNKSSLNRLGITTGKKVGNAVKRNRARRIIREAYRQCELCLPIGYDFVFVARENIDGKKTDDIVSFIQKRLIKTIEKEALKMNVNG